MSSHGPPGDGSAGTGGAHIENVPMKRTMRVYPIAEIELDTLGSLSIHAMLGFSVASVFLTITIGLILDGLISPSSTPSGQAVLQYGPYAFGAPGLLATIYGIVMWRRRGTRLKNIKAQSTEMPISEGGGSGGVSNTTSG